MVPFTVSALHPRARGSFSAQLRTLWQNVSRRRQRARGRMAVSGLDDRMLRDIGASRGNDKRS